MRSIDLERWDADWRTLANTLDRSGEAMALEIGGKIYGMVLPSAEAVRLVARYADRQRVAQSSTPAAAPLRTYLELLRDDPTLVPVVDGQPLEFLTMMNSSFVDPQQSYQFRDPRSGVVHTFWASELQQAIGQRFASVEIVPERPRDVVDGKTQLS